MRTDIRRFAIAIVLWFVRDEIDLMWYRVKSSIPIVMLAALAGCAAQPPSTIILDTSAMRIEVRVDERAHLSRSHPAALTHEQIRVLLAGIRIQSKTDLYGGLATGWSAPVPVFSPAEVSAMAAPLVEALSRATTDGIVTFYRRVTDSGSSPSYTTGGLFVRDGLAYCIVANVRSIPSDTMIVGGGPGYVADPLRQPLLPIGRSVYRLSYQLPRAEVHLPSWTEGYDENKTLVVDLAFLGQRGEPDPTRGIPEGGHAE